MRQITNKMSIHAIDSLIDSMDADDTSAEKKSSILYAAIGKSNSWTNEPNPDNIADSVQNIDYDIKRNLIGAKRIDSEDVNIAVRRIDYEQNTVYDEYSDSDASLQTKNFYVMHNYNVFKCLSNNGGVPSTVEPNRPNDSTPFSTSDGYIWQFMFSVDQGHREKFLTPSYIPIIKDDRIANNAIDGSIDVVKVDSGGSGYNSIPTINVSGATRTSLTLSGVGSISPSSEDNFYNGSSAYLIGGTGAGQIRRITDYDGSSRTLTVNSAFTTVANTDTNVVISPSVVIVGDGTGATAYSSVDADTGAISGIVVVNRGSGYTKAKSYITANTEHGFGATSNVVISPSGGHGSNPIEELYADKLVLHVDLRNSEGLSANGNGYIPSNTEYRSISIIKDPILKVDANNNFASESIANTSNSPATLRLTTRAKISYIGGNSIENPIIDGDVLTNKSRLIDAQNGSLPFITELNSVERNRNALKNATKSSNGHVVYIRNDETSSDDSFHVCYLNNVESYSSFQPFAKDSVLIKSSDADRREIAVVEEIKGPEANTYSGDILYTENIQAISRSPNQLEDIKIILDF